MNNLKLELIKKKEKLAELKQRKIDRDPLKSKKTEDESVLAQLKSIRSFKSNPLNEFENLNADEIVSKCGLLNENNNKYRNYNTNNNSSISHSSSCVSVSVSSSSQSLKSNLSSTTLSNLNNSVLLKSSNGSEFENNFRIESFENFKLTSENNLNVIDIFPNETIKYTKETQTNNKSMDENESTDDDLSDKNRTPEKYLNGQTRFKKNKTSKEKPLAYYDDIFVYDTFQWEDEFSALDYIEQDILNNDNIDTIIKKALSKANSNELEKILSKKVLKNIEASINENDNSSNKTTKNLSQNLDSNDDEEPSEAAAFYLDEKRRPKVDDNDFLQFLKQKRPIIERALKQNENNIFFDYSALKSTEKVIDDSQNVLIKLKKSFCSADKSSIVTCLDWSQQNPELLLCSYDNMSFNYEEAASESVAAIWNSKSDKKVPFQNLSCSSLITSCIFSSHHPNLIIAGTYSGQIVMWDIRCNKQTPIQRSSLSISSHVNPVYCVKVIGNQDAHNLISISNDGKLCSWSLDNLNLPFETQDLCMKNKNVYATCFDFQNLSPVKKTENINELNAAILCQRYAIVGAEDGLIHSLLMNNNNSNNNNSRYTTSEVFNDHLGPITGVSCYNQMTETNSVDFTNDELSQLFLTSSFDGCVKLWNMTDSSSPIHTFECNGDYVYDVSWSPVHPALFACVDGSGKLDIWNLNNDFELPSASYELDNRTRALNRLKWSRSGHEIAVGDDHGQITIFELNEQFAQPSLDESKKFTCTLNTLRQINHDTIRSDKNSYN